VDVTEQVADLEVCLAYLRKLESRIHFGGRLYDLLRSAANWNNVPITVTSDSKPPDLDKGHNGPGEGSSADNYGDASTSFAPGFSQTTPEGAPSDFQNAGPSEAVSAGGASAPFVSATWLEETWGNHALGGGDTSLMGMSGAMETMSPGAFLNELLGVTLGNGDRQLTMPSQFWTNEPLAESNWNHVEGFGHPPGGQPPAGP